MNDLTSAIGNLDDPCELYLPRLRGSAYQGVTIRNILRMCSGVDWIEDGRDVKRLGQAMVSRRPGAILDLMCSLPRAQYRQSRLKAGRLDYAGNARPTIFGICL